MKLTRLTSRLAGLLAEIEQEASHLAQLPPMDDGLFLPAEVVAARYGWSKRQLIARAKEIGFSVYRKGRYRFVSISEINKAIIGKSHAERDAEHQARLAAVR